MTTIPRPLLAIKQDWQRFNPRVLNIPQTTPLVIRRTLTRLISLRTRLTRCRHAVSHRAARLRASLLRSVFSGWRAFIKRVIQHPPYAAIAINHLRSLSHDISPLAIDNWAVKLLLLNPSLFVELIPELNYRAPVDVRGNRLDPWWKALKMNLSQARL